VNARGSLGGHTAALSKPRPCSAWPPRGDALPVTAASVLGGTSLFGCVGAVIGTIVGELTIDLISNGLILMPQEFRRQLIARAQPVSEVTEAGFQFRTASYAILIRCPSLRASCCRSLVPTGTTTFLTVAVISCRRSARKSSIEIEPRPPPVCQPSHRTISYASIGRRNPFSVSSPTGTDSTNGSTAPRTRWLTRIWRDLASSHNRAAWFETVPITA
jgi:hypothetical protein